MNVITLLNSKGGTGKTTVATHLSAGLALFGQRVLLIDADGQGNATTAAGLGKTPKFYDLVVRGASWQDSIQPIARDVYTPSGWEESGGALYCVAGNVETRNIPNSISDETILARRVGELESVVDYIVFDTSPTASLLHSAIHAATDYLLLPTECEGHSALEGLPETLERAESIRNRALQYGLDLCKPLGIIPNKYRSNTTAQDSVLSHLREIYGALIWEPIPMRIALGEASLNRQMIYSYAPHSDVSDSLLQIAEAVLRETEAVHG